MESRNFEDLDLGPDREIPKQSNTVAPDWENKFLKEQERKKAERKAEKARFMEKAMSFDDMFRQSCARVYFMKSKQTYINPERFPTVFQFPKTSDKLLSSFKYHRGKVEFFETAMEVNAMGVGMELFGKNKAEADKHMKECLFAHYGIGDMYTQFLDTMSVV